MKKRIHYLRFAILGCLTLSSFFGCDTAGNLEDPDPNYFVKYYGGDGDQFGVDMVMLNDGTFLLLGIYSQNVASSQVYLVHVNSEGDILSSVLHGQPDEIWTAKDIETTLDGNFVVLADYKANVDAKSQIRLLKFSSDGSLINSREYGTQGQDNGRSVTPLLDGGFIISGTTDSTRTYLLTGETDPDPADAFDIRVDENLNILTGWSPKYIGFGDNTDVSVKMFEKTATRFYGFGYTNSTLTGKLNENERMGLFYFQRNGSGTESTPWYPSHPQGEENNDIEINYVQAVGQMFGGGFLLVGTSQTNIGVSGIFVARMRSTLTFQDPVENDFTFREMIDLGRNMRGVAACTSISGETGFLILGNEVRTTGATNLWLLKIDQSRSVLWSTSIGSEAEDDTGAAVAELPDGKIVILGTMGLADNQFKMAFIKVNRQGQFLK